MLVELCFIWSKRRKESARRKIKILERTEEQKSRVRDSRRGATYMIRLALEVEMTWFHPWSGTPLSPRKRYSDPEEEYFSGDARRCPAHPHVRTSSPHGLYDAPCGHCEAEMAAAEDQAEWEALSPEERERILTEIEKSEAERKKELQDDEIPF